MRKKRELNKIRFAVEIEVEFPDVKDSYNLIEKNRLIRGWELDYDGSLNNGAEYRPKDRNHLYFNEDSFDQIKEIIGLIKAHKGHIKPSCGFHVHIDTKKFTRKEIINIAKAFYKHQDYIYQEFKVLKSREKENAKKLHKGMTEKLNTRKVTLISRGDCAFKEDVFMDRDYGLNLYALNLHNTIEFRFFNGTIQARKIKQYVKWCIEFCLNNAKGDRRKIKNGRS